MYDSTQSPLFHFKSNLYAIVLLKCSNSFSYRTLTPPVHSQFNSPRAPATPRPSLVRTCKFCLTSSIIERFREFSYYLIVSEISTIIRNIRHFGRKCGDSPNLDSELRHFLTFSSPNSNSESGKKRNYNSSNTQSSHSCEILLLKS